jgi:hypothetical protein
MAHACEEIELPAHHFQDLMDIALKIVTLDVLHDAYYIIRQ